jgi:hypothetical protein
MRSRLRVATNFEREVTADNPISEEELRSTERILASLIACAYAADHPELFPPPGRALNVRCGDISAMAK